MLVGSCNAGSGPQKPGIGSSGTGIILNETMSCSLSSLYLCDFCSKLHCFVFVVVDLSATYKIPRVKLSNKCKHNLTSKYSTIMLNARILRIYQPPFNLPSVIQLFNLLPSYHQVRQMKTQELNTGQIKLLMEVFGCSYRKTYKIVSRHKELRTLDQNHIHKVAATLNRLGINKEDIVQHPEVLSIFPTAVENYSMLLEEGGFSRVTAPHVVGYFSLVRKPVRLLKAYQYIPSHVNTIESSLSYLNEPPPPFQPLSSQDTSDEASFLDLQLAVLRHYLSWRLEMQPKELDSLINTYGRIRNKSFRLMEKSLKILEENIGFSKDKIKRHGYLIYAHPDNTLDTLNRIKTIGGMDIKTVLYKYPKITVSATDNLIRIGQHLQDFDIPDAAIQKCPELFTLSSDTVYQRLSALHAVPEFSCLAKHPRVLRLVHLQHKASSRLNYLQEHNIRCASLHLLSSTQAHFDRYISEGSDRTRGNDVIKFLSTELDADEIKLRKMLNRHPFWCHVPLASVKDTLGFLLSRGFKSRHILFNIQALLYSRNVLAKELDGLSSHQELDFGSSKYEKSSSFEGYDTKISHIMSPEKRLALCLYYIEREFHFTGDGIWTNIIPPPTSVPDT